MRMVRPLVHVLVLVGHIPSLSPHVPKVPRTKWTSTKCRSPRSKRFIAPDAAAGNLLRLLTLAQR